MTLQQLALLKADLDGLILLVPTSSICRSKLPLALPTAKNLRRSQIRDVRNGTAVGSPTTTSGAS